MLRTATVFVVLVVLPCMVMSMPADINDNIHYVSPASTAPRHIVNLDLPPKQRWKEIATIYQKAWIPIVQWLDKIVPPEIEKIVDPYLAKLDDLLPYPYSDELRGIAEISTGVGVTLGKLVLLNLIYDISAGCTSIVAQTTAGRMLHARNLDYPIPGLRNITIMADFQRNNRTIYTTVNFAGYIGALTGIRQGAWAVSVNERDRDGEGSQLDNIIEILKGGQSIGFFLRATLENQTNFQDAIAQIQHVKLIAPVYITVSGARTGEGAIVTRTREYPVDVWFVTAPSMWNIIETNYDHWKPSGDSRLAVAMAGMAKLNATTVTLSDIYQVLSIKPVANSGTQYTTLMDSAAGYIDTWRRYDLGP